MIRRSLNRIAFVLALGAFVGLPSAHLDAATLEKINVSYGAISGSMMPMWVTKDTGIFANNGIEAAHRLKPNRAIGLKIAAKYLRLEDKELLQKTYERSIDERKLPAKQYPTLEGLKTIIDQLAATNPKAKAAKPQDFVDARFVEEFDKSGYIDSLYGKKK